MSNKGFVLCLSYKLNEEKDQCSNFGGKCEDIKDCVYKNSDMGVGTHTWNNFRLELIKKSVDIIRQIHKLDKEYENTLMFNSKVFKITLKIEGV